MLSPQQFPPPSEYHPAHQSLELPPLALAFAQRVQQAGGRALLVGGFVRDLYFGLTPGDLDFEVFGLSPAQLEALTRDLSPAHAVGKDFGIIKMGDLDISLPRADRQPGRDGFLLGDPQMTFQNASRRRDFTLNALACDPLTGEVFDCWGGLEDLRQRILTPVTRETFIEDPLRALRAVQFVARFDLSPSPLCREVLTELAPILPSLPRERVCEELNKLFWKGRTLRPALTLLFETGIVASLLPELAPPSLWQASLTALELGQTLPKLDEESTLTVLWSLLLHPLLPNPPEPELHQPLKDYPSSLSAVEAVLTRFTDEKRLKGHVLSLILHQHAPDWLFAHRRTDAGVRRLSVRVPIELLLRLVTCLPPSPHLAGSNATELHSDAIQWLAESAQRLDVMRRPPPMLVQGRDLAPLGVASGPKMGLLLKEVYDWQLDGEITTREDGLERLRAHLSAGS